MEGSLSIGPTPSSLYLYELLSLNDYNFVVVGMNSTHELKLKYIDLTSIALPLWLCFPTVLPVSVNFYTLGCLSKAFPLFVSFTLTSGKHSWGLLQVSFTE